MTPFAYREFFALAEELALREDQAARRTALSRAHYAVLGVALRALPAAEQAQISPGQVHERTWTAYALAEAVTSRQVAGIGYRLRALRRRADYRDDLEFSARDVALTLAQARQALQILEQHGYQP